MNFYSLVKHTDQTIIFSGYYRSFADCLTDAVNKNVDLTHVNLKNRNLTNAHLDGAFMPYADFSGANLTGTNLSEAILDESYFYNCTFYNTCLAESKINRCHFEYADFGATLITDSEISHSRFSTLSCFDLDFQSTAKMDGCVFVMPDTTNHIMSKPPIIIKGALNTPIIILDNVIKVGTKIFPIQVIPNFLEIMIRSFTMSNKGTNECMPLS